jgi:hypothetical protein
MLYKLFSLLVGLVIAQGSIKDCDPSSQFRFTDLGLTPDPPKVNEDVIMKVLFNNPGPEVTEGNAVTSVTWNGIPVTPSTKPLCEATECPLINGLNNRTTMSAWPSGVTGSVNSKIQWFDKDGKSLLCIQTSVRVTSDTSKSLIPYKNSRSNPWQPLEDKHHPPAPGAPPAPHHSDTPNPEPPSPKPFTPAPHHSDTPNPEPQPDPPSPHHSDKPHPPAPEPHRSDGPHSDPEPHHSDKPKPEPPHHSDNPNPASKPGPHHTNKPGPKHTDKPGHSNGPKPKPNRPNGPGHHKPQPRPTDKPHNYPTHKPTEPSSSSAPIPPNSNSGTTSSDTSSSTTSGGSTPSSGTSTGGTTTGGSGTTINIYIKNIIRGLLRGSGTTSSDSSSTGGSSGTTSSSSTTSSGTGSQPSSSGRNLRHIGVKQRKV